MKKELPKIGRPVKAPKAPKATPSQADKLAEIFERCGAPGWWGPEQQRAVHLALSNPQFQGRHPADVETTFMDMVKSEPEVMAQIILAVVQAVKEFRSNHEGFIVGHMLQSYKLLPLFHDPKSSASVKQRIERFWRKKADDIADEYNKSTKPIMSGFTGKHVANARERLRGYLK